MELSTEKIIDTIYPYKIKYFFQAVINLFPYFRMWHSGVIKSMVRHSASLLHC